MCPKMGLGSFGNFLFAVSGGHEGWTVRPDSVLPESRYGVYADFNEPFETGLASY
jgi:hypothetical protein